MSQLPSLLNPLSNIKTNYRATTAPTVNDDLLRGYAVGSSWINTSTDELYFLFDNTQGAAVWYNIGLSGESFKGTWNASTNTPTLADGTGANGDFYLVSVAGTQNLGSGSISFTVGDQVIYNGTIWQKIESGVDYTPENVANKATDFSTVNDTLYPSVQASKTYADAKVADAINDGITTIAPSQNAVFDALALKQTTTLASENILVGNVSNIATAVAMSGDITISNTGVTAIGASKVTNTMLAGGIGNSKLDVIETAKGGTGLTTYTLGDTLYCSAGNILAKLAGNTTTTKKFLSQTGDGTISAAPSWSTVVKGDVGLGNVDNTSDANKPISSATQTALNNKEPTITAGTTTQYWRGDKSWQTLDTLAVTENITNLYYTDARVRLNRLDQMANPAASVSFNSQKITNLLDPTSAQDAATKNYVDAIAQGLLPKQSVRLATTTALPANTYNNGSSGVGATITANATGALTIDSYLVNLNDRILIKNESNIKNGIYICTTAGAVGVQFQFTRASDADIPSEIWGAYVYVENVGTVNGSTIWANTNTTAPTIGTTTITFGQIAGPGFYTAGTGLTLVGNQFSIPANGVLLYLIQKIDNNKVLGNISGITANPSAIDIVDIITGTSGVISVTNGTQAAMGLANYPVTISIQQADATHDGYITQGKYNAFDNKFGDQASQFSVLTAKSTLVDGDIFVIEDSAASNAKKKTLASDTWTYISTKTGTFTNKTISGGSNTISNINASNISSGTVNKDRLPITLNPIVVNAPGGTTSNSNYGYLNNAGGVGFWPNPVSHYIAIDSAGSIRITGGGEFFTVSDARLKDIIGITNNSDDLEILKKIEITNYEFKDKVANNGQHKKVIAQQIQKIYPQAVSSLPGFIPNIMRIVEVVEDDKIYLKNHTLEVGDIVRIINDDGTFEIKVRESQENYFVVDKKNINPKTFIYGKQVNDLLSIDYNALSMLAISAIQALDTKINTLLTNNLT